MQNVSETRIENFANMIVIERVVNLAAITSRLDQIRRAQDAQLVAHYRLFQVQFFCNRAHRHFTRKQQMNHANTRRISKELEELRQLEKRIDRNVLHVQLSI